MCMCVCVCVLPQVHKTGGTTIRDWVAKGQFGEWNIYGWEDKGGRSKLAVNGYCTGNHCNNGVDFLVRSSPKRSTLSTDAP